MGKVSVVRIGRLKRREREGIYSFRGELGGRRVANDWVRRLGVAVCLSYGFMFLTIFCYACKPFCSQLYFDRI